MAGAASTTARGAAPLPGMQTRRRLLGRVAGLLFVVTAVGTVVARNLIMEQSWPDASDLPTLGVLAVGLVCIALPWHRLPTVGLNVLPILGCGLLAAAIATGEDQGAVYAPYAFLVAVYVAYAFQSRTAVGAHLLLLAACTSAPALLDGALAGDTLAQAVVRTATLFAVAAVVVALRERVQAEQQMLQEVARRDPLTNVGNYRLLHERLAYELARHQRSAQPLALLLLDLDDFKLVNDRAGHLAGDRLLCRVAGELLATVRAQDTVARQGGDEFAVLAPETTAAEAAMLAARIQDVLDGLNTDGVRVGVSVGWAIYPDDAEDRQSLLGEADARQREAKAERKWRAGRERRGRRYAAGA